MKTSALVTGGAGFIGSAIARELIARDVNVRIIDSLLAGFESNVPAEAEFIKADIRDRDAINDACRGMDYVFHQAAFKSVPKSIDDPLAAETSNAAGTLNVLMAAADGGAKRVVYASSSSAYGDADGLKQEDMPTNPISPYGVSKLSGEHYCRVWTRLRGLSTVSLRYFNVFGPGQRPDSQYAAVFPAFISALKSGREADIHGDGEQTRDFTFIDDVVRANLLAMNAGPSVDGEVINVCAGAPRSVNEVYKAIADVLQVWIEPSRMPPRVGDIRHSHGDITKATLLLNWAPETLWLEAVSKTVAWFTAQEPSPLEHSGLR